MMSWTASRLQGRTPAAIHRQEQRLVVVLARQVSSQTQAEAVRWQADPGRSSGQSLRSYGSPPAASPWQGESGAFWGPAGVGLDSDIMCHASHECSTPCFRKLEARALLNITDFTLLM